LLASLKKRSTYRILGYSLGVGDGDNLEEEFFVDEVTRDVFALFWEAIAVLEVEAFSCL